MRIGVCIPCYEPHLPFLQYCLQSIEQQTRKPDIVCISISSCTKDPSLDTSKYSFPIAYSFTSDVQYAGKNRNIAAGLIESHADILSFFDADDIMHPRRLELLEKHFTEHALDSCVHYFTRGIDADRLNPEIPWSPITEIIHLTGFKPGKDTICGRVWWIDSAGKKELGACGHLTVKTSVWSAFRYNEYHNMGEDSDCIWRIYTSGAKHGFIPDTLSLYI